MLQWSNKDRKMKHHKCSSNYREQLKSWWKINKEVSINSLLWFIIIDYTKFRNQIKKAILNQRRIEQGAEKDELEENEKKKEVLMSSEEELEENKKKKEGEEEEEEDEKELEDE